MEPRPIKSEDSDLTGKHGSSRQTYKQQQLYIENVVTPMMFKP